MKLQQAGSGGAETEQQWPTHGFIHKTKHAAVQLRAGVYVILCTHKSSCVIGGRLCNSPLSNTFVHHCLCDGTWIEPRVKWAGINTGCRLGLQHSIRCRFTHPNMWLYSIWSFDFTSLLIFTFVLILITDYLRKRNPPDFPPGPFVFPLVGNFFSSDMNNLHNHFRKVTLSWGGCVFFFFWFRMFSKLFHH